MKQTFMLLLLSSMLATLGGCIVRTHSHGPYREARSCPPAYHWEGGACVHNGHGRGNGRGNGSVRDHRY